ncbi:hypothetical protein [Bradyrhizobium sp.]|uniref:hypothetical protein n=1 Tax=Bradyrhizobium sp. TaxID=376 RepID=UPI004037DC24
MKARAAKFVAAILASVISSANGLAAPETAAPEGAEQKADTCLTSPREYAPPGTRWRYRVERGTGRHCWFLKDGTEKAAGKAAEQSTAATEEPAPAPPRKKPAETRSVSDARAEFSRAPVEQEARPAPLQSPPAPAASAPVTDNGDPASARTAGNMLAPAAATRWPDPMSTMANGAANPPAAPADQTAQVRTAPATAPAKPPVMPRVVPPVPIAEKPMSLPMLITVIAGGLSVLGVLASLLFAWLSSRRTRLTPSAPMPTLEVPDAPRRPGDLYRKRKRMRAQGSGRRAA